MQLTSGNGAARFAISNADVLSLAAPLDFESQASYALTVSISDGFNPAVAGSAMINVTDAQEKKPSQWWRSAGLPDDPAGFDPMGIY
jgi:hypothetical protein